MNGNGEWQKNKSAMEAALFLLHDAIIFDCHPECFDKLEDIMAPGQQIPAFKARLYMGAEEL